MSNQERNSINEGQKIGNDLSREEFSQAHRELSHAAHGNDKSFEHVLNGIREGLHGEQSKLSIERDKHNRVTHISFEHHDIYGGKPIQGHVGHNYRREDASERSGTRGRHSLAGHLHGSSEHHSDKVNRAEFEHTHSEHGPDATDRNNFRHTQVNLLSQGLHAMVDLVKRIAREMGLSKAATTGAVAAMLQESGGNPTLVGDHGASVGLFQLNFHGGEGTEAGISKQQAKDPETNARIALKYFKDAQHWSSNPVEIAKLAQRAGDKNYFHKVGEHLVEAERLVREEYV